MNTLINYNAQDIRDQVSPADFLARLGHHPAYKSGKELFYNSMLREERTASFCVDNQLGVWYDHGGANPSGIKGGNIIDLALAYWYPLSFREVLQKITEIIGNQMPVKDYLPETKHRKRSPVKIPHYEIQEVKELGGNPAITEYLQSRKVWRASQGRMKEVYYFVEDQKKLRKYFFAAGWQNELGSWEVRNLYFKGCLGHKAISLIPGDEHSLVLFEGYINYLSWLTEHPLETSTVLILNSISLLETAIRKAKEYTEVCFFFDHDLGGQGASIDLKKAILSAKDGSHHYLNYNDYNDKLRAEK